MTRLEFHFDFGSPNAYLSHLVIPAIEARIGARFDALLGQLSTTDETTGGDRSGRKSS